VTAAGGGGRRRYRIQFVARFEQVVIAESIDRAKQIAEDMQAAAGIDWRLTATQCAWNVIEPLDGGEDACPAS
jgi:hypothetical protein